MANIVLTYRCVNRCPYCFSEQTRKQEQRTDAAELTLEELTHYLTLLRRSNVRQVRLLGGEPFVYRHIETALDAVLDGDSFDQVRVFSAGFIGKRFHRYLADRRVHLLVNVNSPADYCGDRYEKLVRSLKDLAQTPVRMWLGYNIYREDFDYQPVLALAHALGVPKLRWTIANPSIDGSTQCLDREGRRRVIPRILEFLRACLDADVSPTMDCPLEPCLFTDAQLGAFAKLCPLSMAELGKCIPVIDLAPGYKALRCFAAGPAFTADVRQFSDIREIEAYFLRACDSLRPAAAPLECRDCRFLRFKCCDGGCVATRYEALTQLVARRDAALKAAAPDADGPASMHRPRPESRSLGGSAHWLQKAGELAAQGDTAAFMRIMTEQLADAQRMPGTRHLLGRYYLHAGDPVNAVRCLHQSLHEMDPHSEAADRVRAVVREIDAQPTLCDCGRLAALLT